MRLSALHMIASAMLTAAVGCAHGPLPPTRDLIVLGRVKTLSTDPLDELGMNVRFTARLDITRVIAGRPPARTLTIEYLAHMDRVEDQDIRFHLRQSADGDWLACSDGRGRGYVCR